MNYLVANWKSNKTLVEIQQWFDLLGTVNYDTRALKVVICPAMPFLLSVVDMIATHHIPFIPGVQDVSAYPLGSYTGAVAATMVAEWAKYTILGHSERRSYFGEEDITVLRKVDRAIEADILPIICVDEPYLTSVLGTLPSDYSDKVIVAYEPKAAIGSGDPAEPSHVNEIARRIKEFTSQATPVLYGGSTNATNLKEYVSLPLISGALVGGASLDPQEWKSMITYYHSRG